MAPRALTYCKQNISDFSVCDYDQKEIQVDENYCLSVDYRGRPLDIDSKILFIILISLLILTTIFNLR